MEYEKLIAKYNKGKRIIFLVVCSFSIVGYIMDYIIFSKQYADIQKAYHIMSLLISAFCLLMVISKPGKSITIYFNIVAYTAIANIFFSHVFLISFIEKMPSGASNILSRDSFFLLCYLSLCGFIGRSRHIVIQGLIVIILIGYYQWILKDPFYIENGPVYTLVVIGFGIVMYFFTSIVKDSIQNLSISNAKLSEANQELVTQSEELELALKKLQKTQEHLIRSEKMASIGLLAAGVAHEINNPLNFIQGGVYGIERFIEENHSENFEKLNPLLDSIKTGIKRSSDIVSSLNHFSRQSPNLEEICDIHKIIESCLVILQNQLKNKVEIIKDYTDSNTLILGNDGKLHQVFLNILSNSCQAIEIKGTIFIRTSVKNGFLCVSIKDTGSGISEEHLSKVSDLFFTTKEAGKGVGLGLSIAFSIINEHKGSIDISSEPGKETEVIVKLPHQ